MVKYYGQTPSRLPRLTSYRHHAVNQGFAWGADPQSLLALPETSSTVASGRFDVILLCDLVFNHSQHENMLRSCTDCLAQNDDALVLCAFTHHRPW